MKISCLQKIFGKSGSKDPGSEDPALVIPGGDSIYYNLNGSGQSSQAEPFISDLALRTRISILH